MSDSGEPTPATITRVSSDEGPTFFDIPRELRDACYDLMMGKAIELKTGKPHGGPKIVITAPSIVNLLYVSRQFKAEYQQRVDTKTTLTFLDHEYNAFGRGCAGEVAAVKDLVRAEYLGVVRCTEPEKEASNARQWIEETIGRLSNLASVSIHLALACKTGDPHCQWPEFSHADATQEELQRITEIDCVTDLHVYRGQYSQKTLTEVPNEDQLYVRWTEKDGWVAPKSQSTE